jgi:hypothetical protein
MNQLISALSEIGVSFIQKNSHGEVKATVSVLVGIHGFAAIKVLRLEVIKHLGTEVLVESGCLRVCIEVELCGLVGVRKRNVSLRKLTSVAKEVFLREPTWNSQRFMSRP